MGNGRLFDYYLIMKSLLKYINEDIFDTLANPEKILVGTKLDDDEDGTIIKDVSKNTVKVGTNESWNTVYIHNKNISKYLELKRYKITNIISDQEINICFDGGLDFDGLTIASNIGISLQTYEDYVSYLRNVNIMCLDRVTYMFNYDKPMDFNNVDIKCKALQLNCGLFPRFNSRSKINILKNIIYINCTKKYMKDILGIVEKQDLKSFYKKLNIEDFPDKFKKNGNIEINTTSLDNYKIIHKLNPNYNNKFPSIYYNQTIGDWRIVKNGYTK